MKTLKVAWAWTWRAVLMIAFPILIPFKLLKKL